MYRRRRLRPRPAIERYDPPREVIENAKRIVTGAGMELGGVEYLVNERDGRALTRLLNLGVGRGCRACTPQNRHSLRPHRT